jgi:glycosyltransferase involved in cell wall biosynthesis
VEIFNTLDVFVLPSTAPDSFPTVILEAMACRKAIVATTQGGALEMLIHNESGIFIPLDNAKNSAELMVPLLTDPTKRSAMGIAAFERVREKFSLSAFETRLMALINTFHA